MLPGTHSGQAEAVTPRKLVRLALIYEGGLLILAVLLGWLSGHWPWALWKNTPQGWLYGTLATGPLLVVFWICDRLPVKSLEEIRDFLRTALAPTLLACSTWQLFLVALLAGGCEELLFRGVLQPWCGIWLSSLIFGLAHAITPAYAILAGVISLLLGGLLEWTGDLVAPVVTHTLYDFLAFLWLTTVLRLEQADEAENSGRELNVAASDRPDDSTADENRSPDENHITDENPGPDKNLDGDGAAERA